MFELFKKNVKKNVKETVVPTAENMLKETDPNTILKWVEEITEAKDNGRTNCYLCSSDDGRITRNSVKKIVEAGYDIRFSFLKNSITAMNEKGLITIKTGPSLFVRASWNEGCSGKIYDEQAKDYVTPDQMFERIMR